jgi:hypothetical protein
MTKNVEEAAWAICGVGEQGREFWFFESHLTEDEHAPSGKGYYFASWRKGTDGRAQTQGENLRRDHL